MAFIVSEVTQTVWLLCQLGSGCTPGGKRGSTILISAHGWKGSHFTSTLWRWKVIQTF